MYRPNKIGYLILVQKKNNYNNSPLSQKTKNFASNRCFPAENSALSVCGSTGTAKWVSETRFVTIRFLHTCAWQLHGKCRYFRRGRRGVSRWGGQRGEEGRASGEWRFRNGSCKFITRNKSNPKRILVDWSTLYLPRRVSELEDLMWITWYTTKPLKQTATDNVPKPLQASGDRTRIPYLSNLTCMSSGGSYLTCLQVLIPPSGGFAFRLSNCARSYLFSSSPQIYWLIN